MILQALKEYYDREACDPDSAIAPLGWEKKKVPFLAVISAEGKFLRLEDTRELKGKKLDSRIFTVPSLGEAKGNGTKSNLLWENAEYLFGVPVKPNLEDLPDSERDKYLSKVRERHAEFVRKTDVLCGDIEDDSICKALRTFINSDVDALSCSLKEDSLWDEAVKLNQAFLLAMEELGPFPQIPVVKTGINKFLKKKSLGKSLGLCLVSGEKDVIAPLEPPIKGVKDANTMGAHLVSVNNKVTQGGNGGATPSFASYGKEQGYNSPIGEKASLAYSTALNTMLLPGSPNKMQVGDATAVFWASRKGEPLESYFFDLFSQDEPEASEQAVRRLFESVRTGSYENETSDNNFYVLGLSPNSARISVRFWQMGTVSDMEERFRQWFDDLQIVHGPKDKDHLSLWRLLVSTAPQGKTENIPPNLAGGVMRSILAGTPLPETLLGTVLLRVKADHDISYPRMKLVKAFLLRKWRIHNKERSLTMSLDKNNANIGYRLGRLFAVLEKIQQEANPGINATIRDKFYAAASSTPVSVFGNLMRLKNHHLSKIDSSGRSVYERLLGEIIYQSDVDSGIASFPSHLSLEEQGLFAIGYYHQRQDFFTKKEKDAEADASGKVTQEN